MTRREAFVIRAFALWTLWIWGTRIWNIVGDESRTAAFKVVHVVLAAVSIALAAAAWVVVRRSRRRGDTSGRSCGY